MSFYSSSIFKILVEKPIDTLAAIIGLAANYQDNQRKAELIAKSEHLKAEYESGDCFEKTFEDGITIRVSEYSVIALDNGFPILKIDRHDAPTDPQEAIETLHNHYVENYQTVKITPIINIGQNQAYIIESENGVALDNSGSPLYFQSYEIARRATKQYTKVFGIKANATLVYTWQDVTYVDKSI